MQYELFLRLEAPADQARRVLEELQEDPDVARADQGGFVLRGEAGELSVLLQPRSEEQWAAPAPSTPFGLDLGVPPGAGEALAVLLTETAFAWAERWELSVYDPQLGRVVAAADLEAILRRIKRQSDYLTETVGLGAAAGRFIDVDRPAPRLSGRSKFYLGLAGFLIGLVLLAQLCGR
ncbi:MAG: hypothetical protein ABI333_11975 [bacterium]